MTISAGTRLGPYEILSPIGAGGMGEVYRARDTRLAREVAIKVIPEALAADPERLKRFEKEARSASALNHPNIVTIHDIGAESGRSYIAMELVSGTSLRHVMLGGAMPVRKLLQIAPQIAEGLARAHEVGILHRDLKPENIMVNKDGIVKILDFGLAKLTSTLSGSDEGSHLPTMTGTSPGVVVGTVGYMSPEQASGEPLDFRSDQFSLGSILYEMATGKRAFLRKTAIDTLSAILNDEPERIAAINPQAPAPLRWIVERCLSKDPKGRYASTDDLARDLVGARDHVSEITGGASSTGAAKRRPGLPPLVAIAAAVALVAAGLLGGRWLTSRSVESRVPFLRQLTFRRGNLQVARFAPDGKTVVYSADWDGSTTQIYTVRTDSIESRSIGILRATLASVSSKGELAVVLTTSGASTLARVPIGGGTPREVLEDVTSADWAPNGEDLAVVRSLPDGSAELQYPIGTTLARGQIRGPIRVSPKGDLVAFVDGSDVTTVDRRGRRRVLSGGWDPLVSLQLAWSPDGTEVMFAGSRSHGTQALYAVSLSGRERVLMSQAHELFIHDVAADGRLLVEDVHQLEDIACLARGADREREIGLHDSGLADISQDGQSVLFFDVSRPDEVLLRRMDDVSAIGLGRGRAQGLSVDGRWALSLRDGGLVMLPTGPGAERKIPLEGVEPLGGYVIPNGRGFVILGRGKDESGPGLFLVGPEGGKAKPIAAEGIDPWILAGSADGERFAYRTRAGALRIGSLSGGEITTVPGPALAPSEMPAQWSADDRYVYVFTAAWTGGVPLRVDRIELASGKREPWKALMPADPSGVVQIWIYAMSRDGQSYAYSYLRSLNDDLYVMEGIK